MHELLLADILKFIISVLERNLFGNSMEVYLSRILTTNYRTPFVKNSPTSCVSSL